MYMTTEEKLICLAEKMTPQEQIAFKRGMKAVTSWIQEGDTTRPVRWFWELTPRRRKIEINMDAFESKQKQWGINDRGLLP